MSKCRKSIGNLEFNMPCVSIDELPWSEAERRDVLGEGLEDIDPNAEDEGDSFEEMQCCCEGIKKRPTR